MKKILIIGQAPPLKEQKLPYDTTLLYEMLAWVGISKEQAQELFDFEAVSNEFPGLNKSGGHKPPSKKAVQQHWANTLKAKFVNADKVIVLGAVAKKEVFSRTTPLYRLPEHICLDHPSRRNYARIMANKDQIIKQLSQILK